MDKRYLPPGFRPAHKHWVEINECLGEATKILARQLLDFIPSGTARNILQLPASITLEQQTDIYGERVKRNFVETVYEKAFLSALQKNKLTTVFVYIHKPEFAKAKLKDMNKDTLLTAMTETCDILLEETKGLFNFSVPQLINVESEEFIRVWGHCKFHDLAFPERGVKPIR